MTNITSILHDKKTMADFINIISKLQAIATKQSETEFEIRFGSFVKNDKGSVRRNFQSNVELDFFYRLKTSMKNAFQMTEKQTMEYMLGNGVRKIVDKKTNEETYTKKDVVVNGRVDVYDYDVRFNLAIEKKIEKPHDVMSYEMIRNKQRTSFIIPIGQLDLTIVEEIDGDHRSIKHEVELEINSQANPQLVHSFLIGILQTRQQNFFLITRRDKFNVISEYKQLVGQAPERRPDFIGAQPETLQKNKVTQLYKQEYSVTDKADGDRMLMLIDKNGSIVYIDSNLNKIFVTNIRSSSYKSCIIDGELIRHDNHILFLAFDLLVYNSIDIREDTKYLLKHRLDCLNHIIDTIASNDFYQVRAKKYFFNNVFLGSEIIMDTIEEHQYSNDGLIFTPMNEVYPKTRKWSNLLKWKPAEQNTIDFFAVKEDNCIWKLYVQHVEHKDVHGNRNHRTSHLALFDIEKLCGIPLQNDMLTFETNFDDTILDPSTSEPFQTNTVIEFKWDILAKKFVPLRTRWDKTSNPRKHGNFSLVACDIWNNIHNPVEKDFLFKFTTYNGKDLYFERMRRYHNKVKEYLYNKYTNKCEHLLELCSGRGGDMHKWIYNKIQHVTGYDVSEKNLTECCRRLESTKNHLNFNFHNVDLCGGEAVKLVRQTLDKVNVACCHFGVHYFFQSADTFANLVNILKGHLINGGYFITTFMDDSKLNDLFGGKEHVFTEGDNGEIAYYLKKDPMRVAGDLYGNKLRIVLNGNNILGDGSDEYIINYTSFVEAMKEHKFTVIETKSFEDMYNTMYKLTNVETDISFLNRYCVFQYNGENDGSSTQELDVSCFTSPPQTLNPKNINYSTIDLQQKGISLHKITSSHDVIDVVNCLDYKYYKYALDECLITQFQDIHQVFEDMHVLFNPCFVADPLDKSDYKDTPNNLYFTYYKNVVEKKNEEGDVENVEFDNWYVILYNKNMLFSTPQWQDSQAQSEVQIQTASNETSASNDKNTLIKKIQNEKTTIKQLKEYLATYNLKVSGKKEDLVKRLINHLETCE